MNDLGGFAPELNFTFGAHQGLSALLPNSCSGSTTGPANPDGQCIIGGRVSGGQCRAEPPVFVQVMVPYSTGTVAGQNYKSLSNIYAFTHLNRDWARRHP